MLSLRCFAVGSLFILLNLAFTQAVFVQKPSAYNVLSQLKSFEASPFGKKIMETIALQLSNRTPLSEVSKVISDIKSDLQQQQSTADNLRSEHRSECHNENDRLVHLIAVASDVRDDSAENLAILNQEIDILVSSIANKDKQMSIITERISALEVARARDAEAFTLRNDDSSSVLEVNSASSQTVVSLADIAQYNKALNLIVEKMSGISSDDIPPSVFSQLARIGGSNPILSLVSIASTFHSDQLEAVITKLNSLIESINASLIEDRNAERKAVTDANGLAGELTSTKGSIIQLRSSLSGELVHKQVSHTFHTSRLHESIEQIADNADLKKNKEKQCENWENIFNSETAGRSSQIQLVEQVSEILATKIQTMKDYLKAKAEV